MKKLITTAAIAVTTTLGLGAAAQANTTLASEDFNDGGTGDWVEYGGQVSNPFGEALRVSGLFGESEGAYSYYGGIAADPVFRSTPVGDGLISELDVLIEAPGVDAFQGFGFDLTVATSRLDGSHQQDHIFHVGVWDEVGSTENQILVNASNNTDFDINPTKLLNENGGAYGVIDKTQTAWYTLQHVIADDGNGFGQVTFNLIDDEGGVVWTATRPIVDNGAAVPITEVGGVRYMWLTYVNGIFSFDNQSLEAVVPVTSPSDAAKNCQDDHTGFKNVGQCVAAQKAGKD